MTWPVWIVFLLLAGAAAAGSAWLYRRREAPGRGRLLLAALRTTVLVLLLLLLFDPELPGSAGPGGASRAVLVDASLSMQLAADSVSTRWRAALDAAAREPSARVVIAFGDEARAVPPDSLASLSPAAGRSSLLPALQAAAEAGATRVTVITDGALDDLDETLRWLPRLGMAVSVVRIPPTGANRGITELRAPRWAEGGTQIEIHAGIASVGAEGDSVVVSALQDGRTLAQTVVALPGRGRVAPAALRFEAAAPASGTLARYDIVIGGADAVPDDDTRSVYVDVTAEPAGLVLVSFQPDWEPRFLLPVLERALGLPVQGFLRSGPATWVKIGTGLRGGVAASEAEVRRAVDAAGVVVLHGYGGASPPWARERASAARRVMILPAADPGDAAMPVAIGMAVAADWYVSETIPASPIAQHLAGLSAREIPPLPAMHIVDEEARAWAPAHVSRGRRGVAYPIALAGSSGPRRWVIALGEGYWRWAFRDPASRDVYERLWSALGGWLVEDQVAGRDAVAPTARTFPRGQAARWVTSGAALDSFRLRLNGSGGAVVVDTVMHSAGADTLVAPVVPPGHYAYAIRAFGADVEMAGAGPISIESFSAEFTRPAVDMARLEAPAVSAASSVRRTGMPLRLSPLPWLLVITLLCAEWVLRRRWGLR